MPILALGKSVITSFSTSVLLIGAEEAWMGILWLQNQPLSQSMAFAAKEREKGGRVRGEREGESERARKRELES